MMRINVSFDQEIFEELKARMKRNGEKSLGAGIRTLVSLGLKIEKAAQENKDNPGQNDLDRIVELLKNNLTWLLETRLLTRYIVENFPITTKEKQAETLEKYKEKANNFIKGMFGEKIN